MAGQCRAPVIALALGNPVEMLLGAAFLVAALVAANWAIGGKHER